MESFEDEMMASWTSAEAPSPENNALEEWEGANAGCRGAAGSGVEAKI